MIQNDDDSSCDSSNDGTISQDSGGYTSDSDSGYGSFDMIDNQLINCRDYVIKCILKRGMLTHYLTQYLIKVFKF